MPEGAISLTLHITKGRSHLIIALKDHQLNKELVHANTDAQEVEIVSRLQNQRVHFEPRTNLQILQRDGHNHPKTANECVWTLKF
jgi:hypothetical protein